MHDKTPVIYEGMLDPTSTGGGPVHFTGIANHLGPVEVWLPNFNGTQLTWSFEPHVDVHYIRCARKSWPAVIQYELLKMVRLVRKRLSRNWSPTTYLCRLGLIGLAPVIARLLGYRVVVELNGWPSDEFKSRGMSPLLRLAVSVSARLQVMCAHRCISVTRGIAHRARIRGDKALIVPNGTDPAYSVGSRTALRRETNTHQARIVFSGAFVQWQEVEVLVRAVALARSRGFDWELVLVGGGETLNEILDEVARLGLGDAVDVQGWQPRDQLHRVLANCDVGVVPLRPKGTSSACGSPLKLFEYLGCGLRVVASDVDGVLEVADDLPITVYPIGEHEQLADAIEKSLRAEPIPQRELDRVWRSIAWSSRASSIRTVL